MSTLNKPQPHVEELTEESVSDFLIDNPDFFERHPSVLSQLNIPHGAGDGAVSLVERQVATLRQKNVKLERQLRELVEVARGNDELADKIHQLATKLQAAGDREEAISLIETSLHSQFNAEVAVLVIFSEASPEQESVGRFLRVISRNDPALTPFKTFLQSGVARCGRIRDAQRDFLFGTGNVEIGSAALVPLGPKAVAGFLAIGNHDADYFHPGKSMDFLARLGDLVGCAIAVR